MERWLGKTAVVTGASSGIGAALSVKLADYGLTVVGFARRAHLIDKLNSDVSGTGKIFSCQCDITKPEEVAAAFQWVEQKFGGIDILVNNAGVFKIGKITDVSDNKLDDDNILRIIDVNFRGLVMCARQGVASMKKYNISGHIVNVNSVAGHYVPFDSNFNVYSGTKHAVTAFTAALLNEMADFKSQIKVTSISPGLVRTEMTEGHTGDLPILEPAAVVDAIIYALSTPPNVNITEIGMLTVGEKRL